MSWMVICGSGGRQAGDLRGCGWGRVFDGGNLGEEHPPVVLPAAVLQLGLLVHQALLVINGSLLLVAQHCVDFPQNLQAKAPGHSCKPTDERARPKHDTEPTFGLKWR